MSVVEGDPFGPTKKDKKEIAPPPKEVNLFHTRDDVDTATFAHHHTLGVLHYQASGGDHTHNGRNAKKIGTGFVVTGSKEGNVALTSLLNALEDMLGLTDSTT